MKKTNIRISKKNANVATPSIQKFFKSTTKSLPALPADKNESKVLDETQEIYVELLKKKLQGEDECQDVAAKRDDLPNVEIERDGVAEERENVQNELVDVVGAPSLVTEENTGVVRRISKCSDCSEWEIKYKNLKKDYLKMGTNFAELRIKYDDLLSTKSYTAVPSNQSDINEGVANDDGVFTKGEIEVLLKMPLESKNDSTFILKCLRFAYKNNLSVLQSTTMKGTPEAMVVSADGDVAYMPAKDAMSPPIVKAIRELFVKRIGSCNLKPAAFNDRMKDSYMNKLIASGITNIVKSL